VSVVNSPIVVELLVITVLLFCLVLPAIAKNKNAIVASCWTYFTTMQVEI